MPRPKKLSDDAVLDGVLQAMVKSGPEFTLAEAAVEAGIAASTLVQRFGGKEDLVLRVLKRDNERFEAWLHEAVPTRGKAAVIDFLASMTPGSDEEDALPQHLLWLREDFRDPLLNRLTRERFAMIHAAIAERMPPLPIPIDEAVRLIDAQRQGAIIQWGIFREGHIRDYVRRSLDIWFSWMETGQNDL